MIMIEFAGNPGIGKTTLCAGVMEDLIREGYAARNIFRSEQSMSKIRRKLFSMQYKNASVNRELKRELEKFTMRHTNSFSEKWANEILKTAYKLHTAEGSQEVLFMDEGPVQFLTSIVHMEHLEDDAVPVIEEMNRAVYSHQSLLFDLRTSDETTIARLKGRNREKDRFLHTKDMELADMYKIKRSNLDFVIDRAAFTERHIIENDDIDRAAGEIIGYIKAFGRND